MKNAWIVRTKSVCTDMSFRCTVCYGQGDERRRYMGRSKKRYCLLRKRKGRYHSEHGEPLLHAEFIRTLFEYCHAHNITTAIETCLCVGKEQVREVLEVTDYVMCDYKHWNKEKFYQWTGGNLDIIEENLADILSSKKDVVVRIPLIPDFNADKETIQRMCKKLRDFGAEKIELLPYHRLGKIKYEKHEYVISNEG